MRVALFAIGAIAALSSAAAAQVPASFPVLRAPLERSQSAETYRRLPVREAGNEIRIEVNADLLYSFEDAKIRLSASDLFQQAANLIYERAKSPVRIECRSDRPPPATTQKVAQACAAAVMAYLVNDEKVTNVKFAAAGIAVPPPAPPDPRDPFAPLPPRQNNVLIAFAKK
jgi:flagellar motor protein MotB